MINNYRKSPFKSGILLMLLSTSLLSGCTDGFVERNLPTNQLTELTPKYIKGLFSTSQFAVMNAGSAPGVSYQQAQNLSADLYAQYFAGTQTAFASDRYAIAEQFLVYHWQAAYVYGLPGLYTIIRNTEKPETKSINAIARIWRAFVLHRQTDYYGPIPYSEIGLGGRTVKYDSQKDVYYGLFKELDEATADLKSSLTQTSFDATTDVIFQGNNAKWVKFANTLRLRLALRVSNVDPAKAKVEAEAAVAGGVMTDLVDDGYIAVTAQRQNGLNRIADWNEFRMSSLMESIMVGYNDPRLSTYFQPAVSDGKYRGLRNGMNTIQQIMPVNAYGTASNVALRFTRANMNTEKITVLRTGEAYLLRAEGAVNGWNMGGTAADLYAKGIEMSIRTNGVTNATAIGDYINSSKVPIAPGGYFNTPVLSNVPVKFSTVAAQQREQIGIQKWLALYPDGYEAWAEARRSGFPKLYPVINSDNPDLPVGKFIRRIPFLSYDKTRNPNAIPGAISLLGGPDNAATPLWWDKN